MKKKIDQYNIQKHKTEICVYFFLLPQQKHFIEQNNNKKEIKFIMKQ